MSYLEEIKKPMTDDERRAVEARRANHEFPWLHAIGLFSALAVIAYASFAGWLA